MKCTMCDGTGQEKVYDKLTNAYVFIKCAYCNGSGKLSQTNEEWFVDLSTEEKAEWLADFVPKQNKNRLEWYWWLKQPH